MSNKLGIFIGCLAMLFGIAMIITFIHVGTSEEYTTKNIVDCNDKDGDVIEGLICYDVIWCSNNFKFLNEKGCEQFISSEETEQ